MKTLFKIFFVIVLIIAIGSYFFFTRFDSIIKQGLEKGIPPITKTTFTIDSFSCNFLSGSGSIKNMVLGNPGKFKSPKSFSLDSIKFKIDTESAFTDVVIIKNISIDGAEIVYEMLLSGNNIQAIKNNVEASMNSMQSGATSGSSNNSDNGSNKKVIIRHFSFTNAKVFLVSKFTGANPIGFPLPDLNLTDIGGKDAGVTKQEAIDQILSQLLPLLAQTVSENAGSLGSQALEAAKGASAEGINSAVDATEVGAEKAKEALGNLFGK